MTIWGFSTRGAVLGHERETEEKGWKGLSLEKKKKNFPKSGGQGAKRKVGRGAGHKQSVCKEKREERTVRRTPTPPREGRGDLTGPPSGGGQGA